MTRFIKKIKRAWRNEDGVASIEFVFAFPILMAIFMASFESGLFMTRSIMLEQSLDIVMRELRLGHYVTPTSDLLKAEICSRTVIFENCEASLMIDLRKVSTTTFAMPTTETTCVDRDEEIQPVTALQIGQQNELILLRACIVEDAIFPTTGIGLQLTRTGEGGGYEIIAVSAFANEPS
jgi:TadE-like protein